jgi:hypothetical protein
LFEPRAALEVLEHARVVIEDHATDVASVPDLERISDYRTSGA